MEIKIPKIHVKEVHIAVKSFFYLISLLYFIHALLLHSPVFWNASGKLLFVFLSLALAFGLGVFLLFHRYLSLRILFLLGVIVITRSFFYDVVLVSGKSMEPAIREHAIVVVEKFSFGWNIPYYITRITGMQRKKLCLSLSSDYSCSVSLSRGEIAVFDFPDPVAKQRMWIKRIVALGGDSYSFREGNLYINENRFVYEDVEFLPEEGAHFLFALPEELQEYPPEVRYSFLYGAGKEGRVPEGTVMVLGDNRKISRDSRILGFLPEDRITGRVIHVF